MTEYITQQNDVLDDICYQQFGYTAGVTEQTLDENPHLADYGPKLPTGVTIKLPDIAEAAPTQVVNLWD